MSTAPPPVPPANRGDKGPGSDPQAIKDSKPASKRTPVNADEQGETANIRQNTTNQGHQQDR